jgi:hypothetical protein
MQAIYTLGRLVWRPASLTFLFALLMGVVLAAPSIWRLGTAFTLLGFIVAIYLRDVKRGFYAWTLPSIDRLLMRGSIVVAMLFALPLGIMAANDLGAAVGMAALGGAILFFAIGMELNDSVTNINYRRVLFAFVLLAGWKEQYLGQVAVGAPIIFAVGAVIVAAFLFYKSSLPELSRQRPFSLDLAMGIGGAEAMRGFWGRVPRSERTWSGSLRNASISDWIRVAAYECQTVRGHPWVSSVAVNVIVGAVTALALNSPSFAAISAGPLFVYAGLRLKMSFYPVSRHERARIFYLTSLFENFVVSGAYALGLWLVFSLGLKPWDTLATNPRVFAPSAAAFVMAFVFMAAPVAQWVKVYAMANIGLAGIRTTGKALLFQFAFVILAFAPTLPFLKGMTLSAPYWLILGFATIVVQGVFWYAVKRHFENANLITG